MKLRRTKKDKATTVGRTAPASQARPARQQTRPYDNTGSDGLPGKAGYPDGPNTSLPNFFNMRRPDGRGDRPAARRRSGYHS